MQLTRLKLQSKWRPKNIKMASQMGPKMAPKCFSFIEIGKTIRLSKLFSSRLLSSKLSLSTAIRRLNFLQEVDIYDIMTEKFGQQELLCFLKYFTETSNDLSKSFSSKSR